MAGGKVEIINSKGCSRLLVGISSAFPYLRGLQSFEPPSPAVSVASEIRTSGPFAGLVICVTGLSKEARKQVMDATERLGGQYSPNLSPQCTHLVVQSFGGRKFEHALKHGLRNGLFIVTLGWFVDSVRRNVRLNESLYNVKSIRENGSRMEELNRLLGSSGAENSCLPMVVHDNAKQSNMTQHAQFQLTAKEPARSRELALAGHSIYMDPDISPELRSKIIEVAAREGASFVDHWFIGCSATHVVCEEPFIQKYLGHASNLVTPLWILKTVKERCVQRLVHMSADVARQVSILLERKETNHVGGLHDALISRECPAYIKDNESIKERQQIIYLAKTGARHRRDRRMQTCQNPIRPITPGSLLDSICWSISEPTSSASIYTEPSYEDVNEHTSLFYDAGGDVRSETSFENLARPLRESEKMELVFRNHFLTILFPIDRFGEMGPSSRTFFSDKGFTCLQVLDLIYAFYQENMSADEVDSAIHTDSRHADRLRSVYANMETAQRGFVQFKRIDFLGSRKSFEMLKRVSGDNNSNVYELLIRA